MTRVTTPIRAPREARTPMEQGISLLPYLWLNQRLHRRRWAIGLTAVTAAAGLLGFAAWRRRANF